MKKKLTKALCVGLSVSMVLSMASCGKKKGGSTVSKDYAKQNVYKYDMIDFGFGENYTVNGAAAIGDKIYFLVEEYNYDTWEQEYMLASVNKDGTDPQKTILPKQYEEAVSEEDVIDIEDIDEEDIDEEDIDEEEADEVNSLEKTLISKPITPGTVELDDEDDNEDWEEDADEEEDDEDADDSEDEDADDSEDEDSEDENVDWGDEDFFVGEDEYDDLEDWSDEGWGSGAYEYSSYVSGMISEDGVVYAVRSSNKEDYSDPENYSYEENYYLDAWECDGTPKWEVELKGMTGEGAQYYVQKMLTLSNGDIGILVSGEGKLGKIVVDKNGNTSPLTNIKTDNVSEYYLSCVPKENGKVLLSYYSNNEMEKVSVCEVDMETGNVSSGVELPTSVGNNFYTVFPGKTSDFIYASGGEGLYTYSLGDAEAKKMMDFVNSDINIGSMSYIYEVDDSSFVGLFTDAIEWKGVAAIFHKVDPKDIKDKDIIVIGGSGISYDGYLKKRVIDFNKINEDYRIVVKDYSVNDNTEDGSGTYTQLNNDIISGNMPDVLVTGDNIPVDNYIAKGLFANIDEFIAKDEELSKVDFVDNVFEAYRINGKLYQIIPSFMVQTFIAKTSLVGNIDGWNMEEMKALQSKLPANISLFPEDTSRSSFLYNMMEFCGNEFIDVESGKCHFDSQEFIEMLELAKGMPEEFNYEDKDDNFWMTMQSQYRDNRTLLKEMYISSFRWVKEDINGYMGEEISYVGFPTENRKGSVISATTGYAISEKSKNKEGAWEFIRYYLTEEYQKSEDFWGLSVHKALLEEAAKEAMQKSYWEDENGQKIEYEDTIYINGQEVSYNPLNQQQVDQLLNFIYSVDSRTFYNEDVSKIVTEEADAFFAGQKSAKEVTDLIQNRVQLYINENR